MNGLTSTLLTASQALNAESGAIAVTNTNIANVNTPGYSRQVVVLSPAALQNNGVLQENGVSFDGFSSVRNQVLQLTINQSTSDAGALSTASTLWSQIEGAYSGTNSGLGAAVTTMFTSLSALSATPKDAAAQQAVLGAAGQLSAAFHQAAAALSSAQSSANDTIYATVTQINQLTSQIANLNKQVTALHNAGQDGGTIEDQRDQLTSQLAQLVGVNTISTEGAPTLSLNNGTSLVSGSTASALQAVRAPDGEYGIQDTQGNDVTGSITGGALGGALSMRDQQIPAVQSQLDSMAYDLGSAMNTVQSAGFDATGAAGKPLFSFAAGQQGAAASIATVLTSPTQLGLNSSSTANDAGNLPAFLALGTQPLASGLAPSDTYASLVQTIGSASAAASSSLTATNANLAQLTTQQRTESGVSVDEETTNLLRYQQAYSAAAQVISTVNNLFSVLMNMTTVTG